MPVTARPTALTEAFDALDDRPDAQLLAGGTDFMVEVNFGHRRPSAVVALRRVAELQGYQIHDDEVVIGAGTTWTVIERELADVLPALANGAVVTGCSNMHYSSPTNLISPGEARVMGEGWETARRRDDGNDWVEIALAGPGVISLLELDTSCFVGNAPGWAQVTGTDGRRTGPGPADGVKLLPRTRLQPDTRHRFRVGGAPEVAAVRVDVYPDGGMARVRMWGQLSVAGREALLVRWYDALPGEHARAVLRQEAGLGAEEAAAAVARRPAGRADRLPRGLRKALTGQ